MQLNQVRYFVEAARLLNFTKAADVCCVTQPALTKGIKGLEDELGGALFHRVPKLALTDLGRSVLPFIEQTYEAARAVQRQARSYRSGETNPIAIGCDPSVPNRTLQPILAELSRVFTGIALRLDTAEEGVALDALLDGVLDILVRPCDGASDKQPLHHLHLVTEPLVLVCGTDHQFAGSGDLELDALLASPDRISISAAADRLLNTVGASEPARHMAGSEAQLDLLMGLNVGWSLLPERHPLTQHHVTRPLPKPGLNLPLEIVYLAGRPHSAAVSAFLRLVRLMPAAAPQAGAESLFQ